MKGFTLIELLIVFAFIGVLTALGLASYASYNSTQAVHSSAADVATMLNTAKSRALAQVIPSSCAASVTGYEVDVTVGGNQYKLYAVCTVKKLITTSTLPPHVTFAAGSDPTVFFAISTGGVAATNNVIVTGYGKTKTITINPEGNVSVN